MSKNELAAQVALTTAAMVVLGGLTGLYVQRRQFVPAGCIAGFLLAAVVFLHYWQSAWAAA